MKIITFLTLLLFLPSGLEAQNSHKYFPHHVNNLWQWMDDEGRVITYKFVRDSIDQQGNTFINLGPTPFPMFYWYWKIDPEGDSIYHVPDHLNWLQYKFPADSGETWLVAADSSMEVRVDSKEEIIVWGIPTTALRLSYYSGSLWYWTEVYAYGIGQLWYGDEVSYMNLIGCVIDGDTLGIILDADEKIPNTISKFELHQNYPNPFNPVTKITYNINKPDYVDLRVYDSLGEEVSILVHEYQTPGYYSAEFNAINLSSGVYFYKLAAGSRIDVKKMMLLR